MCGLVACFGKPGAAMEPAPLKRALDRMHNRGPDAEGVWQEPGVWLGHRRLAILDLDERANQPMRSACGRYVIVFNGEIYNFRELRSELAAKGFVFRTSSDTEVLLALFAQEGAAMLSRLRGMFALVIWDSVARRAFAARDPYGIKPLYWAQTDDGVLLASQVKALLATGKVSRAPCALGQAGFWLLGSVAEPHTWYRDIRALPAGHCAWIEDGRMGAPECWWDIAAAWRDAPAAALPAPQVRELTRAALRESVAAHLVADVPVGVFLSGGIDSGALAGLMVEAGARDLQGITIAYDEFAGTHDDEAPLAATLAAHYGIAHHVRRVTRDEFAARPAAHSGCHGPAQRGWHQHLVCQQGGGRTRAQGGRFRRGWRRAVPGLRELSPTAAPGVALGGGIAHSRRHAAGARGHEFAGSAQRQPALALPAGLGAQHGRRLVPAPQRVQPGRTAGVDGAGSGGRGVAWFLP